MTYKEFLSYKPNNKKEKVWYEDAKKKLDTLDYVLKTDGLKGFNIISYFVKSNLVRWDADLILIRDNNKTVINCGHYEEKGWGYDVQAESILGLIRGSMIIHRLIDLTGKFEEVEGLYTSYFSMKNLFGIEDVKDLFKDLGFDSCITSYVNSNNREILNLVFLSSKEGCSKYIGNPNWDFLKEKIDDYMVCGGMNSYNPATKKYDGGFAIYDLSEEVDLDYFKRSGKSIEEYADEILENWDYDYWNSELYDERDRLIAYLDERGYLTHYSGEFEGTLSHRDEWEDITDYFLDSVKNCPDKEELMSFIKDCLDKEEFIDYIKNIYKKE